MSKSPNILIPALGGAALLLGLAYGMASRDYGGDRIATLESSVMKLSADAEAARVAGEAEAARAAELAAVADDLAAQVAALSAASLADSDTGDPMPQSVSLALGRAATEDEVAAWDIDVRPDGLGLPEGRGDVMTGEEVYTANCAMCHGDFGEAVGRWPVLAGGDGTLAGDDPVKTIGSYWPYLSTVYDYVHRAMPFGNAQSLSDDEVYSIVAYLLFLNDLVDEDFELSRESFAEVEMPNVDNFYLDDRADVELTAFAGEVCMEACKESVEIVGHARVVDVTPDDAAARARREEAAGETTEPIVVAQAETGAVADASDDNADAALVAAGEGVFRQCKACHQIGEGAKNASGPMLTGVVGTAAASVDGFRYSNAMAGSGIVWTKEALAGFLADPRGFLKGTKMSFRGVKDEADLMALIAYLGSFQE